MTSSLLDEERTAGSFLDIWHLTALWMMCTVFVLNHEVDVENRCWAPFSAEPIRQILPSQTFRCMTSPMFASFPCPLYANIRVIHFSGTSVHEKWISALGWKRLWFNQGAQINDIWLFLSLHPITHSFIFSSLSFSFPHRKRKLNSDKSSTLFPATVIL